MKKAIAIIILSLLWCNVGFADSPLEDDDYDSRSLNNNLTKHGWKIDSVKQVSIYKEPYDIYILKNKGCILYCKIEIAYSNTDFDAP